jgi:hypothetical protein
MQDHLGKGIILKENFAIHVNKKIEDMKIPLL